jgi:hypothetical protein
MILDSCMEVISPIANSTDLFSPPERSEERDGVVCAL